jgi:hypothetical protein
MITFEEKLSGNLTWALEEADRFFSGEGRVWSTLRTLAERFNDLQIDFAVVGAVAMFCHGYRRFTEDVDILVTPQGLAAIDARLLVDNYTRPAEWRRSFRDPETGVAIHVLVTSSTCGIEPDYALPSPSERSSTIDGINILDLAGVLEMKFAIGSAPGQLRHLGDAQELIRYSDIPAEFGTKLRPQFRDRFAEYWLHAQVAKRDDY